MSLPDPAADKGVYGISVAAGMTGLDPQSLRLYEKRGLLEPDRTAGGTRLYSADDVARLHRIRELLAEGVNLAGISMVMALEADKDRLEDHNTRLDADNAALRTENRRLRRTR